MKWLLAFVLLLCTLPLQAQQITVTGNATDSDGQQWIGGTYQITLVRPGGLPNFYCTSTGTNFPASFGGTLDGTGSFSVQLTTTACIVPTGSLWKFQICPNVTNAACGVIEIPVTTSGSISSQINAVILAPRVTGGPGIHAYNDTEVAAFSPNTYFNVISQQNRCYSTSWSVCTGGGGGGATLPFPGLVYGTSATGGTVATSSQVQTAIGSGVYDVSGAAATAQTNAENFTSASYAPLASPTFTGTVTAPNLTLSGITGSTQCLEISSSGVVSGTGGACGSGSGAVNSVTNSDGTLTISPTSGSVIASLALGHANTWTGTQTFVAPALGTPASGVVTNLTGTGAFNTTGTSGGLTGNPNIIVHSIQETGFGTAGIVANSSSGLFTTVLPAGTGTLTTGPNSAIANDVATFIGTSGQIQDSNVAVASIGLTSSNLSQFAAGGAINPSSTGATTPGTGAFTTLTATTVAAGSSPPTACGSATGCLGLADGSTAGTPTSAQSYIRADSTTNTFRASINNGTEATMWTGTGTTGTITGSLISAACDSGTATVAGAIVGHPVAVSSTTGADVGAAFNLRASVTSANTVTVYVCNPTAVAATPTSLAYNVTVF